jgi:TP901 family phage tail tape measure protein
MGIDLGSAFGKIQIDAQDALNATEKLGGVMGKLGGAATLMGGAVVAGGVAAGAALAGLGISSVGVARDFESAMAVMSTAVDPASLGLDNTQAAMDMLGDAALAVGSDMDLIGVSGSSAAEAMTGLYKAGLTTGEIFGDLQGYLAGTAELGGALRASIDLAAASELDMVAASDLASVTLATFGGHLETEAERAEFINSAMNNFVQTADASVASVSDLAAAMVNVGPTAAAFGFGVEDVNAALGILSTRGIAGSEAGTALKSMLTNMMRTTDDVTETLEMLNVELYNTDGTMRSLPQIMSQFEAGLAGLTEEERNLAIQTVAGTYGMNAMNALLGEGTEGWLAMEEAVAGAATMQETAAARTNTLAGAQEALAGVWETFQIQVGTALIPVLTLLADVGAQLIDKYGPVLVAVFETVAGVFSSFFNNLQEGMSPLNAFIEAIWDIAPQPALDALINLRDSLLPGLTAMFNQVVAAVVPFVQQHGPTLLKILGGVAVGFAAFSVISTVVGWITGLIAAWGALSAAITAAGSVIGGIVAVLGGPVTVVIALVAGAIALLTAAWTNNWFDIQGKTAAAWAVIQPILVQIRDFILNTVIPAAQELWRKWTQEWWPEISTALENAWTIISVIFEEVGRWVNDNLVPWIKFFRERWEEDWEKARAALDAVWVFIEPIWTALQEWLEDKIPVALDFLQRAFNTELEKARNAIQPLKDAWDGLVGAVQGFWDWLSNKVFDFKISIPDLPDWAVPGSPLPIHSAWLDFANDMPAIGRQIADAFLTAFSGLEEQTKLIFDTMSKLSGLGGGFASVFQKQTIDPLETGLKVQQDAIKRAVEAMGALLPENFLDMQRGSQILRLLNLSKTGTAEQRQQAQDLLRMMQQEQEMNIELIAQKERLVELQEAQAEMNFLQQQMELLKLINENNLGADLLDGLKSALGDPAALVDVMNAALERMIEAARDTLGIASASKVFRKMSQQIKEGMLLELADTRPLVAAARRMAGDVIGGAQGMVGGNAFTDASRTAHLYGGQHFYFQQPAGSILDDVQLLLAP